ncbi:hypothetical protein LINPERPRIM_LOCUS35077 [Linum perenne]
MLTQIKMGLYQVLKILRTQAKARVQNGIMENNNMKLIRIRHKEAYPRVLQVYKMLTQIKMAHRQVLQT